MGENALKSQLKSKKYCKLSPPVLGSFCKYFTESIFSLPSKTSTVQNIEKPSTSKTLDLVFINELVITAEIRWLLHVVLSKAF